MEKFIRFFQNYLILKVYDAYFLIESLKDVEIDRMKIMTLVDKDAFKHK